MRYFTLFAIFFLYHFNALKHVLFVRLAVSISKLPLSDQIMASGLLHFQCFDLKSNSTHQSLYFVPRDKYIVINKQINAIYIVINKQINTTGVDSKLR